MANENLPKITKEWAENKFGIACDCCGGTLWYVTHTKRRTNEIVRIRVCRNCKYVVHTVEKANS